MMATAEDQAAAERMALSSAYRGREGFLHLNPFIPSPFLPAYAIYSRRLIFSCLTWCLYLFRRSERIAAKMKNSYSVPSLLLDAYYQGNDTY